MYRFAVLLSGLSACFGLIREVVVVYLLGFSNLNDQLQIYLSIFFISSLSTDAVRLATLNLIDSLSFIKILAISLTLIISLVGGITAVLAINIDHINYLFLTEAAAGSALNLIIVIILTYKQRLGNFILPQITSVLPNLLLIPYIFLTYYFYNKNLVSSFIFACFLVPIVQIVVLFFAKTSPKQLVNRISNWDAVKIFYRHALSTAPAQLFQLLIRPILYHYGAGYLSVASFLNRVYLTSRVILIDSYIAVRMADKSKKNPLIEKFFFSYKLNLFFIFIPLPVILWFLNQTNKINFGIALCGIFLIGFYFDALWRVIYFETNKLYHDKKLIYLYFSCELFFVFLGYFIFQYLFNNPIWYYVLWFMARPFCEILLIGRRATNADIVVFSGEQIK
ncbi:MAG: hypothetical protein K2Q14_07985 [Gammaproteobacteria bacterium]|nr:hypothetical protein [Gammaproteobacteria bacterium]